MRDRPSHRPRRPSLAGALLCAAALLVAAPAAAELVILDDGDYFKVTSYEVAGERARLVLPEGGRVTLPLARIERVVDDEWVPPAPEPPPLVAAARDWRFAEHAAVPAVPYGEEIYEACRRHGVDPELVAALIRAESAFQVRAVSHAGARGLMQLMPATARRFGVAEHELFVPERNMEAGVRYLAWLLDRFDGRLEHALAGYNAGEGTVDRYGGVPPYRETRDYIRRIYRTLGLDQPVVAAL